MGRGRAPCCDKNQVKKGPWSPAEDLRLISFIQKHGHGNWRSLPKQSGLLRCGKSCRLRWINYLRPDVKRGNFTPEEEEAVIKLHDSLGNKWSKIASHLPGRTDNEIKNVWNTHLKKKTLKKDANCGNKDETKGSSITSSSSLPSSPSSNISYGDQNREKGLGGQDFVANRPNEEQDPPIMISSPTDEPKEASSSSSSISSCASREEMGSLFNFEGVNEVHNAIHEAADQEVSDEVIEIPLESDIDFWNMLDNMDLFQSNETQPQPSENSQSSNFGEEHNREVECRKWMRYLENELGLVGTTSEVQDNPQNNSDHEEMILNPSIDMGLGYFPMWPSSPQNFGI